MPNGTTLRKVRGPVIKLLVDQVRVDSYSPCGCYPSIKNLQLLFLGATNIQTVNNACTDFSLMKTLHISLL